VTFKFISFSPTTAFS